jgi:hypothetical protein
VKTDARIKKLHFVSRNETKPMPPTTRRRRATTTKDDESTRANTTDHTEHAAPEDELRDVSPSEAYGFAGMVLTTVAFILWLFAVFASPSALESYGAPSGALLQHYARVAPCWLFAACVYALLGYECLNLMSTPDDADARLSQRPPDPSEYAVRDPALAAAVFDVYDGENSTIPMFRDISRYEASVRMFGIRNTGGTKSRQPVESSSPKDASEPPKRRTSTRRSTRSSG